ncbi:hypothetical protein MMC07_009090 [Pseudocyphellaria aurata]|nr:hypothetical protein [Pseudocyphellaria aurata]
MNTTDHSFERFFWDTSRRWIFDETERIPEHYMRFNVDELMRIAARVVKRPRCVNIEKLAEGYKNKVFILTMNDGFQAIARLPKVVAGTPQRMTASEVATMDYLRNCLGIPVPHVYGWDCGHEGNPVGAEYIIMEKVEGDILRTRWKSLTTKELGEVIQEIVNIESQVFSAKLPKYGSLYYTMSVEEEFHDPVIGGKFCVGPLATHAFWQDKRSDIRLDRGPWILPEDYLRALGAREARCTHKFGKPRLWQYYTCVARDVTRPQEHISLLSQYNQLAPYLIPKEGKNLSFPTLRHCDLRLANIILHPGSTKIAGILDWQNASILPFFLQSGYPDLFQSSEEPPLMMEFPKLPDEYAQMTLDQQKHAWDKMWSRTAILFYTAATLVAFQLHTVALQLPYMKLRKSLISQAGRCWDGNLLGFQDSMMRVRAVWDIIAPGMRYPCRIIYTYDQLQLIRQAAREWMDVEYALANMRRKIGIDQQGGTRADNYQLACARNRQFRLDILRGVDDPKQRDVLWKTWPYKDKNDLSLPPPKAHSERHSTATLCSSPLSSPPPTSTETGAAGDRAEGVDAA